MKKNRSAVPVISGTLDVHPDGYAFLVRDDQVEPDIFVPARKLNGAAHRDRVAVSVGAPKTKDHRQRHQRSGKPPRLEGEVVEIRTRGMERIVGVLAQDDGMLQVKSDDVRLSAPILIPPDGTAGARVGQTVAVQIIQFGTEQTWPVGKIIQILGARGELATEIAAVLHHHAVPLDMPAPVEAAAMQIVVDDTATSHRDCRHLPLITIDGESAKDFDDAVATEVLPNGGHRVWVAIADVAYFVRPGGVIDDEAIKRGVSVYFPDRVLPMLPHRLSDELCSLRPQVDRLALIAEFVVTPAGTVEPAQIYRGVIRSRQRCTYTQVQQLLDKHPEASQPSDPVVLPLIQELERLCRRLRAVRLQRGSLDFDLPEPQVVLDMQGAPEAIIRAPRYFAHQMIEELMVAANEAVATFLVRASSLCVFRIHPPPAPDSLLEFRDLLKHLQINVKLAHPVTPSSVGEILRAVEGHPASRMVNHKLLRCMSQATYDIKNMGHFGLASTCYCHFTSPIRRYPDLLVHRLLLQALKVEAFPAGALDLARLKELAQQSSRRERVAMEAEREMQKVYQSAFLKAHVGSNFTGVVSHVTSFGFYVEFDDMFVEGLVHRRELTDDWYQFNPKLHAWEGKKLGKRYAIGDRLTVTVEEVRMEQREVQLKIVHEAATT